MSDSISTQLHAEMIAIPGGSFTMGSERFYPEEAPVRRVRVDPFRIDVTPVTNAQFTRFVAATGHVTSPRLRPIRDELAPNGAMLANYWQGRFPFANQLTDGWLRTSPVTTFPPNGYGIHDMIGNVWEWTADWFAQPKVERKTRGSCCVPANPRGGSRSGSIDKRGPDRVPRKVMKGGSHLCAESYCRRYRPAARYAQAVDITTGHVGFRCVVRGP